MQEASQRIGRSAPILERPQRIAAKLRSHLRERPYWTTAAIVGVGWALGRSLPLRAVLALAGIGARVAIVVALELAVSDRMQPRAARTGEAT